MNLNNLLENIKYSQISTCDLINKEVEGISIDSRKEINNGLFIAIKGVNSDGHQYINNAIDNGYKYIVLEDIPEKIIDSIVYLKVDSSSKACGLIACNWYNNPSSKTKLIGVTGTNGKTTTATLLYQYFKNKGKNVGLISTIENKINNTVIKATHTTPDAISLNNLLNQMVNSKCEYVFMEVSSHALQQDRTYGLNFKGGIFTNLTHDHIDYHLTFANYINAKKIFFDNLSKDAFALTNIDDKNGSVMLQNCKAKKYTYSLKTNSDFKAKIIEQTFFGMLLNINGREVWTQLIGNFNAYNLLAIYGTITLLEETQDEALQGLSKLKSANGRFEIVGNKNSFKAIIDYAHTPDALKNVIDTINLLIINNEKLIVVFGCGGDRDHAKRPEMGKIASENADKIIITTDNPRFENPEAIINDILQGVETKNKHKVLTIINRREAIQTAAHLASSNDIILIAGKGHENYQDSNGIKTDFDDKKEIEKYLI